MKIKSPFARSVWLAAAAGLMITIVFVLVWDTPIQKCEVHCNQMSRKNKEDTYWIADDVDTDGNSELIRFDSGRKTGDINILLYDENGKTQGHWRTNRSNWEYGLEPAIYDVDDDGSKEVLFFSYRGDSVFFNVFRFNETKVDIETVFFEQYQNKRETYAHSSQFGPFGDFDGDGKKELFFHFDAGYGLYPRGIFKVNFPSMEITGSPTEYMVLQIAGMKDITGDGIPEILTNCKAPNNIPDTIQCNYPDTLIYLTVLDYNLNLLFEPVVTGDGFGTLFSVPSSESDSLFYAFSVNKSSNRENWKLKTVNNQGEIQTEKVFDLDKPEINNARLKTIDSAAFLLITNMGQYELTPDLNQIPDEIQTKNKAFGVFPLFLDLNHDGREEYIFPEMNNRITIFNPRANENVCFDSPVQIYRPRIFTLKKDNRFNGFLFSSRYGYFYFNYVKNTRYFVLYLIYFAFFVLAFFFIFGILNFQNRYLERRRKEELRFAELQFNAVKNQLNPHFLFNALNSVAFMIQSGQKHEAYDFLTINARMLRQLMDHSGQTSRPLKEELDFTRDFLKIQEQRFKDKFRTLVEVEAEVDQNFLVPKMCIHTYTENAIKHGFKKLDYQGVLKIEVKALEKGVFIAVSDNGPGRNSGPRGHDSAGHGIQTMDEFYRLFEKYHGYKITTEFIDLLPEKDGQSGLRVEVIIEMVRS